MLRGAAALPSEQGGELRADGHGSSALPLLLLRERERERKSPEKGPPRSGRRSRSSPTKKKGLAPLAAGRVPTR
jgi:hypothetical protein